MPDVVLDANMLILLVSGTASKSYLGTQRRLHEYSSEDFERLIDLIRPYPRVIVTPNVLTEASNIIDHMREPIRSHIALVFKSFISEAKEL